MLSEEGQRYPGTAAGVLKAAGGLELSGRRVDSCQLNVDTEEISRNISGHDVSVLAMVR